MINLDATIYQPFFQKPPRPLWGFGLLCLTMWLFPFIVIGLSFQIQEGFNFYHMTMFQAKAITVLSDALTMAMLVALICCVKKSRMAVLPLVVYFSWSAVRLLPLYLVGEIGEPLAYICLIALVVCGLGSEKTRRLTAYGLVFLNICLLGCSFYREVFLGSFEIINLPN